MSYLSLHKNYIKSNDWLSITSFTNEDGEHCSDSCPSRALSIS